MELKCCLKNYFATRSICNLFVLAPVLAIGLGFGALGGEFRFDAVWYCLNINAGLLYCIGHHLEGV